MLKVAQLLILLGILALMEGCSTTPNYRQNQKNDRNLIKQKSNMEFVLRSYRV